MFGDEVYVHASRSCHSWQHVGEIGMLPSPLLIGFHLVKVPAYQPTGDIAKDDR
jgi:hypothetical protein